MPRTMAVILQLTPSLVLQRISLVLDVQEGVEQPIKGGEFCSRGHLKRLDKMASSGSAQLSRIIENLNKGCCNLRHALQ